MTRGPNREQHARAGVEKQNDLNFLVAGKPTAQKQTDLQFLYMLCSLWYSLIARACHSCLNLPKKRLHPSPSNWRLHKKEQSLCESSFNLSPSDPNKIEYVFYTYN